ncbi:hypothetical protein [Desulfosporosinus lacus]|uniref:hypothetical protein n=1 Tax=Desulfosporosinus lacus TaxID=329936 RepID=UPI0009346912|nr:hypothetical protein [Desulfosporosinus lacus]
MTQFKAQSQQQQQLQTMSQNSQQGHVKAKVKNSRVSKCSKANLVKGGFNKNFGNRAGRCM